MISLTTKLAAGILLCFAILGYLFTGHVVSKSPVQVASTQLDSDLTIKDTKRFAKEATKHIFDLRNTDYESYLALLRGELSVNVLNKLSMQGSIPSSRDEYSKRKKANSNFKTPVIFIDNDNNPDCIALRNGTRVIRLRVQLTRSSPDLCGWLTTVQDIDYRIETTRPPRVSGMNLHTPIMFQGGSYGPLPGAT